MTQNMSADGRMFSQSCSESRLTFPANAILCIYFIFFHSMYILRTDILQFKCAYL